MDKEDRANRKYSRAIKPCPFCGMLGELVKTNDLAWWVRCTGCNAETDSRKNPKWALLPWNQRA